jgi:hypothetical protein
MLRMEKLMEQLSKPKKIVRGADGRPAGIE